MNDLHQAGDWIVTAALGAFGLMEHNYGSVVGAIAVTLSMVNGWIMLYHYIHGARGCDREDPSKISNRRKWY
jgi:hypothetical protein